MLAAGPTLVVAATLLTPAAGFDRVAGEGPRVGEGRTLTYSVDVERALRLDPARVTAEVDAALADPRGWIRSGRVAFRRVQRGAQMRVVLARPATTDRLCAPIATLGRWSCNQGTRVVLNGARWRGAVGHWRGGRASYRRMLVNHEVGHRLGLGHAGCPAPGARAPVMLQQSIGLQGCRPGPWPREAELALLP